LAELLDNISGTWARASLIQRILLVVLALGGIAAVAAVVNWAREPDMVLLYAGLEPEEAARICEKIRDEGVPYKLKDGGTTVFVPQEKVYSLRLTMAGADPPTGGQGGYSILDEESFGQSPFEQKINYWRALEGELARSIQLMNGVNHARVHLVKPDGKVFSKEKPDTSATVMLQLRAGTRLSSSNVAAVVYLVAGAVEGLEAQNVSVVDSNMRVLSGGEDDTSAKKAGTFFDYQTRVEEYYARQIEDMLAKVLGPDRSSVRVSATVDWVGKDTTTTTYGDGTKSVAQREQETSETTGPAEGEGGGKAGQQKKKKTTETDFKVPQTVKAETAPPGQILTMTVSALVDLSQQVKPEGEEAVGSAPASPLTLDAVKKLIVTALGVKDETTVTVSEASFYQVSTSEMAPEGGMFSLDNILRIVKQGSLGILVMGALLVLKMFGRKKVAVRSGSAGELPAEGAGGTDRMLPERAGAQGTVRAQITQALQDNPEEVKRLFLSWVEGAKEEA
jgi:flagellar M-ring protein FliF